MVMKSFRHRLPPLNSLLVFEAAARSGNFTRAAAELHMSQAAVSKQIKGLEAHLGTALFERQGRRVALTAGGRQLQEKVNASLNYLADAVEELTAGKRSQATVTLAANTAVSYFWLNRALAAYHRAHPDHSLNFRVLTSDHTPDLFAEDVDIAMAYDPGQRLGWSLSPLFGEELIPVASTDYLRSRPVEGEEPSTLFSHRLLDFERIEPNWINWKVWFEALGLDGRQVEIDKRYNNYVMLLEAAERGEGITLATRCLLDARMAESNLVQAMDVTVRSGRSYCLALNEKSAARQACQDLFLWLLQWQAGDRS